MDPGARPFKTEAGQREIGARKHKLSWQARALLVSVSGDKTVSELGRLFKSPEITSGAIDQLLGLDLIAIPRADVALPPSNVGEGITSLQQARQLLNDTAVMALGFLGGISALRFTLKLEHCYSAPELRAIYPNYRQLVARVRGEDFVNAVLERVDELLAKV